MKKKIKKILIIVGLSYLILIVIMMAFYTVSYLSQIIDGLSIAGITFYALLTIMILIKLGWWMDALMELIIKEKRK